MLDAAAVSSLPEQWPGHAMFLLRCLKRLAVEIVPRRRTIAQIRKRKRDNVTMTFHTNNVFGMLLKRKHMRSTMANA